MGRSCIKPGIGYAILCALWVLSAPRAATANVNLTFSGIIGSESQPQDMNIDSAGYFGEPGTNLEGKSFSLSLSYDPAQWQLVNKYTGTYYCGSSKNPCTATETLVIAHPPRQNPP
jgi:hypothetical protein